ncbi:hypothetical protein BS17DRAFT_783734 [Gyrodon lividus]|nr:hypothetical protein BS17DRAFT_783734 [Gyrodon lividus]
MSVVVVTITTTGAAVTPTSTQASANASSTLPPQTVAGIVIGILLGGVLFIGVVFYLLNRRHRGRFARVANPAHDRNESGSRALGGTPNQLRSLVPSSSPWKKPWFAGHSQQPSVSFEPLMSPVQWPSHTPLPPVHSQNATPPRSDPVSPGRPLPETPDARDSQYNFHDAGFDLYAEISQVVASGSVPHRGKPATLSVPPPRRHEPGFSTPPRSGSGGASPQPRNPSDDAAATSPPPVTSETYSPPAQAEISSSPSIQPRPTLFIHRLLKSRAQASESMPLSHQPSLSFPQSRSTTMDSSYDQTDEDKLLADAERTALRDVEAAYMVQQGVASEGEDEYKKEPGSPASAYSQLSASIDHSSFLSPDPFARGKISVSLDRRKSSRRRARTHALPAELPPVAELPDASSATNPSRPSSTTASSSLDVALSHGRSSRPPSLTLDHLDSFPLLTSTAFGKSSSPSTTPAGSISGVGQGSSSSGRASRYPSLAPSSIGRSSGSHPHSESSMDWHHPPTGLAALKNLQAGPMRNPHSPIEPPLPPLPSDASFSPAHLASEYPKKRAHLREGTASSLPEVEKRSVMQGGIASIDVAL